VKDQKCRWNVGCTKHTRVPLESLQYGTASLAARESRTWRVPPLGLSLEMSRDESTAQRVFSLDLPGC
jgi:hypothetical protein